jgi:LysR family transcriptional regulator, glycine cleavage system transcriptional activator
MDLRRSLPPLNLLKAFEAAARHQSFTRAAEELFVTQAAVSQQVKALEAKLDVKLFDRAHKQLSLTDAGREYLGVVREALDRIAIGTMQLVQRRGSGVLNVSTSPDFASKWLVPRIGRFAEVVPDVDLRISATPNYVDLARSGIDVAIRHGDGQWQGLEATRLYSAPEVLFPVCSPKLLEGRSKAIAAREMLKFPLLRLDGWSNWARWFAAAGVATRPLRGPTLGQASMLIDAAIDGQGIALARTGLAARDLLHDRLTIPVALPLKLLKTYWIVHPIGSSEVARVSRFKEWALAEASAEYRQLQSAWKMFGS